MGKQITDNLERALPWSVIGLVATVLLGLPALYLALHVRAPKVELAIESIANVFDLHRPLPDLTILFKGSNIQDENKNLQIVTFTLRNVGEQNVLQGEYDQTQPFGTRFQNAQIVGDPRVVRTDSEYLASNLAPRVVSENTIEFNKVILERDKSATIEILILHDQASVPVLKAFGKIAGQDAIQVVDLRNADKPGFWRVVMQGGVLVNVVRFFTSVVAFIAAIILLIYSGERLSLTKKRRNAKLARKYLSPIFDTLDQPTRSALLGFLAHTGSDVSKLKLYLELLRNKQEVQAIANTIEEQKTMRERVQGEESTTMRIPDERMLLRHSLTMLASTCFDKRDNTLAARPSVVDGLESLIEFLTASPPPKNISWYRLDKWK